ncbi:hypothetical protein N7467_012260 [Penicillium canescens]|nr:hypothetical protein N7467_012260 [Penicillium canescens]
MMIQGAFKHLDDLVHLQWPTYNVVFRKRLTEGTATVFILYTQAQTWTFLLAMEIIWAERFTTSHPLRRNTRIR